VCKIADTDTTLAAVGHAGVDTVGRGRAELPLGDALAGGAQIPVVRAFVLVQARRRHRDALAIRGALLLVGRTRGVRGAGGAPGEADTVGAAQREVEGAVGVLVRAQLDIHVALHWEVLAADETGRARALRQCRST